MYVKVTTEQFSLERDKVTHQPTGARFWLEGKDVVCGEPGCLTLETGDRYNLDDLKDEARRIVMTEHKSCI